jgi:hypothetical protein
MHKCVKTTAAGRPLHDDICTITLGISSIGGSSYINIQQSDLVKQKGRVACNGIESVPFALTTGFVFLRMVRYRFILLCLFFNSVVWCFIQNFFRNYLIVRSFKIPYEPVNRRNKHPE